jgi:hypothetical protein
VNLETPAQAGVFFAKSNCYNDHEFCELGPALQQTQGRYVTTGRLHEIYRPSWIFENSINSDTYTKIHSRNVFYLRENPHTRVTHSSVNRGRTAELASFQTSPEHGDT